jgi:hypothetical protein
MEAIDEALTLRPVGPPRHMGVEVVRHSTQLLLPSSTTPIPSTCKENKPEVINIDPVEARQRSTSRIRGEQQQRKEESRRTAAGCTFRSEEPIEAAPDYGLCRSVGGLVGGNILLFSSLCFFLKRVVKSSFWWEGGEEKRSGARRRG